MGLEIERKYLLAAFPSEHIAGGELKVLSKVEIDQTYLALTETEEIRVRRIDKDGETDYTHTFKRGYGLSREEVEYAISADIYKQLLEGTKRKPLKKIRTTVTSGEYHFEIDEYLQYDLLTVDVEFASVEEAHRFTPPAWFGREIGSEYEYRNKQLWLSVQSEDK